MTGTHKHTDAAERASSHIHTIVLTIIQLVTKVHAASYQHTVITQHCCIKQSTNSTHQSHSASLLSWSQLLYLSSSVHALCRHVHTDNGPAHSLELPASIDIPRRCGLLVTDELTNTKIQPSELFLLHAANHKQVTWLVVTEVQRVNFGLVLHAQQIFANSSNLHVVWWLPLQFSIPRAYFDIWYGTVLAMFYVCIYISFVFCRYVELPYNTVLYNAACVLVWLNCAKNI